MAKNQELYLTAVGKLKQVLTPTSLLNTLVYTEAFDMNVDGIRLLKVNLNEDGANILVDIEFISIAIFDGTDYHEISRLDQTQLAANEQDFFNEDTFPLDRNNNKYLNLDYSTGKIVIGIKSSSINNVQFADISFYYEEYS